MAKETKVFAPNETQVAFLNALKDNGGSATLFELNYLKGNNFKSGAINTLKAHGYVEVSDGEGYDCDVVYAGVVVGHVHKPAKVYTLTGKAY